MPDNTLASLRRRLHAWELQHLRQLATELSERLDHAEEDAHRGWLAAEAWREDYFALVQETLEAGESLGMTKDGRIGVLHDASLIALLHRAEDFIAGFEDDDMQDGVPDLLRDIRAAITPATTSPETPCQS